MRGGAAMISSFFELRDKDVVNINNGEKLGRICDIDIELDTARVCALILPGRCRVLGLFGREDDISIAWNEITLIGEDVILVNKCMPVCNNKRSKSQHID